MRHLYLQVDSSIGGSSRLGAPSLVVGYDSRDNILTPTKGLFTETAYSYFDRILGRTFYFQRVDQIAIGYLRFNPKLTLGIYTNASLTFGDPVLYARPYVTLRGIPAVRYQRQNLAESELELRWQFHKRFSVVGFGGAAVVWNSSQGPSRTVGVGAGGAGFRYLLARKFGLHYGIDVARGAEDWAIYFQFGSAWMRP
jgi:hypothetical protein